MRQDRVNATRPKERWQRSDLVIKMINILQVNNNTSARSHDLACISVLRREVDLILISEPNKRSVLNKRNIYINATTNTAIVNYSGRYGVAQYGQGLCFTWVKTEGGYYFYSTYISPNCSPEEYTQQLDDLTDDIRGKLRKLFVSGDFNSKSTMWRSNVTDRRGEELAQCLQKIYLDKVDRSIVCEHNNCFFGSGRNAKLGSYR